MSNLYECLDCGKPYNGRPDICRECGSGNIEYIDRPTTTQVFKQGQQAAFDGKDKSDNPHKGDATLGRVWKKGYDQHLVNRNQLFDFTERFSYPKAKMTRPHILLKNGDVLRFCSLNAGQFVGYDGADERQSAMVEDVAAIQYNHYTNYLKWRKQTL